MTEEKRAAWVDLLTRPGSLAAGEVRWRREGGVYLFALLVGTALYGAAVGFFDGGWQVLVGAVKVPLVLAGALLLCLPSFVVVHLIAGVELRVRRLLLVLAGWAGCSGSSPARWCRSGGCSRSAAAAPGSSRSSTPWCGRWWCSWVCASCASRWRHQVEEEPLSSGSASSGWWRCNSPLSWGRWRTGAGRGGVEARARLLHRAVDGGGGEGGGGLSRLR